jgi:hypothetical protein
MGRLVRGESTSQVTDIRADAFGSPIRRALADLGGARTMIWVALRKEEALLGCIAIYRQEVRPFADKEIALLEKAVGTEDVNGGGPANLVAARYLSR